MYICDRYSSVVLAQSSQRSSATQAAVESFLSHLAWIKVVSQNLLQLHIVGHSGYQTLAYAAPLTWPWQRVRDDALTLQTILEQWLSDVTSLRHEFYFLNFFTLVYLKNNAKMSKGTEKLRLSIIISLFQYI